MKELLESLKDSAIKHGEMQRIDDINPVSYTHLTLPTIA